jgi:hypothetical protein
MSLGKAFVLSLLAAGGARADGNADAYWLEREITGGLR